MSDFSKALQKISDGTATGGSGLSTALNKQGAASSALATVAPPKTANVSAIETAIKKGEAVEAISKGVCFVIDATASRAHTWQQAQRMQADMFAAIGKLKSNVEVGIVCHSGGNVRNLGWFGYASAAAETMVRVSCVSGQTRVADSLAAALKSRSDRRVPSSIILVGDAFEEDISALNPVIQKMKDANIKVFAFLEGNNAAADKAFRFLAEQTGGVFKVFGDSLDANLADLSVAAAVFDTGGAAAFRDLLASGHKGALALKAGGLDVKQLGTGGRPNPPKAGR